MTEPEKIKRLEEQITLAGLLPGINLDCLPPEESAKLKRVLLDVYRLSHARGFKAGAEHARNSINNYLQLEHDNSQIQLLARRISAQMREGWRELKKLLRSIRATVLRNQRPRRFPTEALSGNWAVRR
jgi:hypothetical protein